MQRRYFHLIALVIPSVCLALITSAGCNTFLVLSYITIALSFTGFAYSSVFNPNVLDLAPNYAGVLFGIANTVANLTGFIAPQMAGNAIDGEQCEKKILRQFKFKETNIQSAAGTLCGATRSSSTSWARRLTA